MIINQLMALLLPSVVTLKVYENLEGEENRTQKIIKKYLKALLIVNFLAYSITIFLVKQVNFVFTNQFTVKYMAMALVIAIIYPIIEKVIRTNINIMLKVEPKNEEKN